MARVVLVSPVMGDACRNLGGPLLSFGGISPVISNRLPHTINFMRCPTLNCSTSVSLILKLEYAIPAALHHGNPDPAVVVVSGFTSVKC